MNKYLFLFISLFLFSCGHTVKVGDIEFLSKEQPIDWSYLSNYDTKNATPFPDSTGNEWNSNDYISSEWKFLGKYNSLMLENWGCDNCDKFLKGTFRISEDDYAENAFYTEYAGNDGIWMYVNGNLLGHYGGEVHQSGNVNLNPDGTMDKLPKVKIPKEYMKQGENIIKIHATDNTGKELVYFKLLMSPF
jgi:hypothetical protein